MTQGSTAHNPAPLVRDIGEFTLIQQLRDVLPLRPQGSTLSIGIGDDAAIWNPGGDQVVVTTDALVEGVHFRLDWTDWRSLGHKMLAVNLSDLAAMGAKPALVTIVLGLTGNEAVTDVLELYRGAGELAAIHGVDIAGGDVVKSPGGLTLGVTAMGTVKAGEAVLRRGAKSGDMIVVSGTLGASAAGMELLARGHDDSTTGELLRVAHLRPNPRIALGAIMHECGVSAAMDLSDGLLGDLPKILAASNVAAEVELDRLPIIPAVSALFPDQAESFATRGGEDYELLMTISPEHFEPFRNRAGSIGATLTVIGAIKAVSDEPPRLIVTRHGEPVRADPGAWDHFATAGSDDRPLTETAN